MRSVGAAIPARTDEGHPLLVARELNELAQVLLGEAVQGGPEVGDVRVCVHEAHLVHGVHLLDGIRFVKST